VLIRVVDELLDTVQHRRDHSYIRVALARGSDLESSCSAHFGLLILKELYKTGHERLASVNVGYHVQQLTVPLGHHVSHAP
jgi:hypothetical protein